MCVVQLWIENKGLLKLISGFFKSALSLQGISVTESVMEDGISVLGLKFSLIQMDNVVKMSILLPFTDELAVSLYLSVFRLFLQNLCVILDHVFPPFFHIIVFGEYRGQCVG